MLIGERRRRISPVAVGAFARLLTALQIEVEASSGLAATLGPVRSIAREHGLSAYDASYVEVAVRRGVPLATLDAKMRTAAARLGVPRLDGSPDAAGFSP